ncbi:carboxylesterase from carbohydrate esterase like protein [Zymoseptoria brevis]|uniref:Carboxylesterase from carbohydrate esterase like protein n=1 Tax=Zymoseptoria brevis TaxID=1047168 RepID=A0A0F4GA76_9PEZI|nr:carboxylesterase from carbohydrate esterase like protein [Zymoseptoria brevis]
MKVACISIAVVALCTNVALSTSRYPGPNPSHNDQTSLTLLYQNNLNASDDVNHKSALLLDPTTPSGAAARCALFGETLLTKATLENYTADFVPIINYLLFSSSIPLNSPIIVADALLTLASDTSCLSFSPLAPRPSNRRRYPALCTQSSRSDTPSTSSASSANQITISDPATKNTYTGYRNLKSFRFLGIPYTNMPTPRWTYSSPNTVTGTHFIATTYGSTCPQTGSNSSVEDCLFLNIQTPYIPSSSPHAARKLRPVLVNIHGGGFTGGSSNSLDGSDLASRHDIVMVSINYRLSTLGFLAVPGTAIRGNFGLGDQVSALKWVRANIAAFGGDPSKVTIMGESAGAGSVRALLGAPDVVAQGLVQGAVAMSNLGGGRTLGLQGNYGTEFSEWKTIEEGWQQQGSKVAVEAGCADGTLEEQVDCLRTIPADELVKQQNVARFVLQDGEIVTRRNLNVVTSNGTTAHIPVIFGTTANDGASFSTYPAANITSENQGIQQALGISEAYAQSVIDSGLFPLYDTGNLTLDAFNVSQRIATDATFRCIDEATVYAGAMSGVFEKAYYYTIERTWAGYDPNDLGLSGLSSGPITSAFPSGNPEAAYFRLHGADLGFAYGNQAPLRDAQDLMASQLISGYFAQFAKTGDPNANVAYLQARGYTEELEAAEGSGSWDVVSGKMGPGMRLDAKSRLAGWEEMEQCAWLGYGVEYYVDGGI